MTIFNARDPAAAAASQLGLMSAVVASTLTDCMMSGLDAMDRARERREATKYADDLEEARCRADELGRMAIRSARRVAALEAQIRSLKACLTQRQAFIDAVKAGRIVLNPEGGR